MPNNDTVRTPEEQRELEIKMNIVETVRKEMEYYDKNDIVPAGLRSIFFASMLDAPQDMRIKEVDCKEYVIMFATGLATGLGRDNAKVIEEQAANKCAITNVFIMRRELLQGGKLMGPVECLTRDTTWMTEDDETGQHFVSVDITRHALAIAEVLNRDKSNGE